MDIKQGAQGTWARQNAFQMPTNPLGILDMCPANLPLYRGLFVLYKENSARPLQLKFIGFDPCEDNPILTIFDQPIPEDANRIASFENKAGFTDLLVSGKSLAYRSSQQFFEEDKSPLRIASDDPLMTNLSQFYAAQSNDILSVWSLGKQNTLAYQEFSVPTTPGDEPPAQITPAIPLLDNLGGSGRFTALQNQILGQKVFVISDTGAMKVLEQSIQTGIWQQPVDIMIPDSEKMIEFTSYTIHVALTDQDNIPMVKQEIKLSASTSAELIVNGSSVRGSPEGQTVHTDEEGSLTIIIRSEGLSAPLVTLGDPATASIFQGGSQLIDPMSNIWSTVGQISSGQDLKEMKLPDGTSFVREGVSDNDLEKAATALRDLHKVKQDLSGQQQPAEIQGIDSIADRLWGAWFWICEKVKEGWNYVVKKVKEGWQFILELGGKAWSFVLENAPQVAAAVQAVLGAVSEGWEWVKRKLSFLFNWGDIIDVKNLLVNMTTKGLLSASDATSLLELKAEMFFEDLRKKVRDLKNANLPPEILKLRVGKGTDLEKKARANYGGDTKEAKEREEALASPQAQYGFYHSKHGGTSIGARTPGQTTIDRVMLRLNKVLEQATKLMNRFIGNFGDLFTSSDFSVGDLLSKTALEFLEDSIGVMESLATGILGSLSDLILEMADIINHPINIPVLSPLYNRLTGSKLTVLDAVCLILAIPATIIYKLVTGKSPVEEVEMKPLIRKEAFRAELDARLGRSQSDQNQHKSFTNTWEATSVSGPKTVAANALFSSRTSVPKRGLVANARVTPVESGFTDVAESIKINKTTKYTKGLISTNRGSVVGPSKGPQTFSIAATESANAPALSSTDPILSYRKQMELFKERQAKEIKEWGIVTGFMRQLVPCGSYYVYNMFTWGGLSSGEPKGTFWEVWRSPIYKLVLWLAQCWELSDFAFWPLPTEVIAENLNYIGFRLRFETWRFGGIAVVGRFIGKYVGYIAEGITCLFQLVWLIKTQATVRQIEGDYSDWLAGEEWVKLISKFLTVLSGLAKGEKEPVLSASAYLVTNIGIVSHSIRAFAEATGLKDAVSTGMGV